MLMQTHDGKGPEGPAVLPASVLLRILPMWMLRRKHETGIRVTEAFGASYRGGKKGPNQDRVLLGSRILSAGRAASDDPLPLLMAVADGISGDPGGHVAADTAVRALIGSTPKDASDAVDLMGEANEKICAQAAGMEPSMRNMCTTISAAWIERRRIVLCARGDTPIYLVGNCRTAQVSKAHTDRMGRLTSYLGADTRVTVQTTWTDVLTGSLQNVRAVVIMSDGISRFVAPGALAGELARADAPLSQIGMTLMHEAWNAGSKDNLSFVMARIEAV